MQLDFRDAVRGKFILGANILKGKYFLLCMLKCFYQERIAGGWEGEEVLSTRRKAMSPG